MLATDANGVTIEIYLALIASLLIVLWTGLKPTRRTWETVQFYLSRWASLEELERHLAMLKAAEKPPRNDPATGACQWPPQVRLCAQRTSCFLLRHSISSHFLRPHYLRSLSLSPLPAILGPNTIVVRGGEA